MKLIILIGCSATGKDYILKKSLHSIKELNPVISYTTRPMRVGEVNGVDYHFIDTKTMTDMLNNNEFIETRQYNVACKETWCYGLHKDSIDIDSDKNYIAIVDLEGFFKIQRYFMKLGMKENLHSIYIKCSAQTRLLRSLHREGEMKDEQVKEIIRRFEDDELFVVPAETYVDVVLKNEYAKDGEDIIKYIKKIIEVK